jgi:cation diffusion facilitator family transporter
MTPALVVPGPGAGGAADDPLSRRHDERRHRREANRAVGLSALGLGVTGLVELILALVTGSVALLGDAIHNLADVSTSLVVFLGFHVSKRPATATHPYGYERAEDLAGLGVALVIWASAAVAGYESVRKLLEHAPTEHVGVGIAGAAIGMLGNQLVARYKAHVGRRIQSATLVADARHSWLDALSSLGALVGLVVVATGHRWGDPVAGVAVTLFIVHVGHEVTAAISRHLMDGIEAEHAVAARDAALSVEGVDAATVRGRWMGRSLILEVEAELDPATSLDRADSVGRQVEAAVLRAVDSARQVRWIPRPGGRPPSRAA